jgi:hypothetical protein
MDFIEDQLREIITKGKFFGQEKGKDLPVQQINNELFGLSTEDFNSNLPLLEAIAGYYVAVAETT